MLTTIMKMHLGDTIFLKRIFNLEGKIVSVKNTVESVPAHEFRQYVENHHVQARNKLLKKTLVELQPHQHILYPMARGSVRSPHEGDTGMEIPCEVLVVCQYQ